MNRLFIFVFGFLFFALPLKAFAQNSMLFPLCGTNLSFSVPFMYVESPSSTNSSWSVCARALPCQGLVRRDTPPLNITPPEVSVSAGLVEIKATFVDFGFGVCPPPQFYRLEIPPVPSPGPITIRYSNRAVADGLIQVATDPYIFRQEITAVATTASTTTPVPSVSALGQLALVLLMLALGIRFGRR